MERIAEVSAQLTQARTLAVPTLRAGTTYDRHTGNIQETGGQVLDVDRVSQFTGIGAGLGVDVADAVFAPLVARQNQAAVTAASTANRHLVLLEVASAYLRLLQSREETSIAQRALERALDLATLTADYAEAGEGLLADAEMAAVQPLLWEQRRVIAVERTEAAAAELARLLHLDAGVELEPLENEIPVLELFSGNEDVEDLVSRALLDRPEAEQYDALMAAAEDDLNAQRYGLFIPSVALNYTSGQFGGAPGSSIENRDDREDLTLSLYWQLDNFGFGYRARTNEKRAQLRQASLERDKLRDGIAAEVRAGHARVRSFAGQLEFAQSAVARAEQAYRLNRERIFDQQGLPLEALAAMQTLAAAEVADLDARVGHALAEVRLHTMLGNPLDSEFP
jgi:outer membrane protein TolC